MKVEDAIKNRRSVRRYKDTLPQDEDIKKILVSASWAPSGLNNQPWKFKTLKEKKIRDGLAKFTKYGNIIKEAPLAIIIFLDNGSTYNREKDIMAIGASIENMLIQAYELGLGTCWLGEILNKQKEVEEYLGVDSDYELMACVTVGYPAITTQKSSRKPLNEILMI